MKKILLIGIILTTVFAVHSEEDSITQKKNTEAQRTLFLEEEKAEREALKSKVPQMIEKLKSMEDGHKEVFIMMLSQSGDKRAIQPLTEVMLNSKDARERAFTAERLGIFRDPQTIPAFKTALLDTVGARSNAAMALYWLGELDVALPELEKLALEGNTNVFSCFYYVNKKGEKIFNTRARSFYMKAIKGHNEDSRAASSFYLAEIGEKDIPFQAALDILQKSKKQVNRELAVSCMVKIGDDKAARELSKLQGDQNLHAEIIRSLIKLNRNDLIKTTEK